MRNCVAVIDEHHGIAFVEVHFSTASIATCTSATTTVMEASMLILNNIHHASLILNDQSFILLLGIENYFYLIRRNKH
jgi:hypothetical protein